MACSRQLCRENAPQPSLGQPSHLVWNQPNFSLPSEHHWETLRWKVDLEIARFLALEFFWQDGCRKNKLICAAGSTVELWKNADLHHRKGKCSPALEWGLLAPGNTVSWPLPHPLHRESLNREGGGGRRPLSSLFCAATVNTQVHSHGKILVLS